MSQEGDFCWWPKEETLKKNTHRDLDGESFNRHPTPFKGIKDVIVHLDSYTTETFVDTSNFEMYIPPKLDYY